MSISSCHTVDHVRPQGKFIAIRRDERYMLYPSHLSGASQVIRSDMGITSKASLPFPTHAFRGIEDTEDEVALMPGKAK
ncbi:hypothetical protein IAQ61_000812, partial [Plenodomus lingam]